MAIKKVYELAVDLKRTSVRVNIPVLVQGDSAEFRIRLLDNGAELSTEQLTGITKVSMQSGYDAQTVIQTVGTLQGSVAVFRLKKNELFRSGTVQAMVQLEDTEDRISTLRFQYQVIPDLAGNYIPGEQDITVFQRYMNEAQAKIDEMAATDVSQFAAQLADNPKLGYTSTNLTTWKDRFESNMINVKDFGAKGDGVTDDTTAIQAALTRAKVTKNKKVYIPGGKYIISDSLVIATKIHFIGNGADETIIEINTNSTHAIKVDGLAYRVQISEMSLSTNAAFGTNNAGVYFDPSGGAYEFTMKNVTITSFKYGISCAERWWMNTLDNVRINICDISFFSNGTTGTSINNLFSHCYSDRPLTGGFLFSTFKNSVLLNCNFGGGKGNHGLPTYAMKFISMCMGFNVIGANIEHHISDSAGIVQIWSGSNVSFDTCNFFDSAGISSGGYFLVLKDESKTSVQNCGVLNLGTNIRGIYQINKSRLFTNNNDDVLNDVVSLSTNRPISGEAGMSGSTAQRPTKPRIGQRYFDTTISQPVWCKTSAVLNALGEVTTPAVWTSAVNMIEVGFWTPKLIGSTGEGLHTYTIQFGSWTKVSNMVTVRFNIRIAAGDIDSAMTGNIQISGLPFTSSTSPSTSRGVVDYNILDLLPNFTNVLSAVNTNKNIIEFLKTGNNVATNNLPVSAIPANQVFTLTGEITYQVP